MATEHKQKVTLSLDGDAYRRLRALLARIPGKPSVSSLVDDLFRGFVATVGPVVDEIEGDPAQTARALVAFHGELVRQASVGLDQVVRSIEAEEAGRE